MTAREMFKELGFEQIRNDGHFIKYKKADDGIDKIITFSIMFRYFDSKYGDYPFTAPYEFEFDLLNAYKNSGMRQCIPNYGTLLEMYGKGHFKGIDTSTPIHEILDNCEVIE